MHSHTMITMVIYALYHKLIGVRRRGTKTREELRSWTIIDVGGPWTVFTREICRRYWKGTSCTKR